MRRLRWIAAAACGLMCGPVFTAGAADGGPVPGPGLDWSPVPDSALEEVRGGFDLGGGMVVSLGVERLVSINGSTVASSQFSIADLSRITAGEAQLAREAVPQFAMVQNGAGNSALLPAGEVQAMSALLIQNTMNDQAIRSQTTINASVSSQALLTAMKKKKKKKKNDKQKGDFRTMERNHTMMQFFEWHVPADGRHWQRLKERSAELKAAGIDAVWIPPATKASSPEDNGYSIYDLYDLGEFDQKGAVRTKYGTKAELLEAIQACKQEGIAVYADLVMNHKAGADEKEKFKVVEVEGDNRQEEISDARNIEGWTRFTFPGRGGKYSDFTWNFNHFNGTDFDAKRDETGVYRILGENKDWNENVDDQFGNYDYLMFANIDYNNPEVREEMIKWGKWLVKETGVDGFRLDAIKHIDHTFIRDFAHAVREDQDGPFYIVGEFWNSIPEDCFAYLDAVESSVDLFDAPLHYRFKEAAQAGQGFDLRTIFDGSIVKERPLEAVTLVDNHDTQPGEALESWVDDWFKQSAYALILLRKDGYPVVFYGDYYGIGGEAPVEGKKMAIDPLLYARYHRAYGDQDDYFDDPNVIGWVRRGVQEFERSGCAVVVCNKEECSKRMFVGEERSGQVWVDLTNTRAERIVIGEDGFADFPVNGGSVSVWALPEFDVEPEGGE